MALKGKSELLHDMQTSAANMAKVRRRKETERVTASQAESETRTPPPVDLIRK